MTAENVVILIVDDEPVVRALITRILERAGYKTLGAADGREAFEICESTDRIDAVLSDISMPRMAGPEFAKCLADHYPKVPILFMTGHATHTEMEQLKAAFPDIARGKILQKPFSPVELVSALQNLISQG